MKTLIINGSPRKNGDTVFLLQELKKYLNGEIIEINAYFDNIKPCIDCRACKTTKGCVIQDDMSKIYNDDFDNVIIASPLHFSAFPGPVINIASRFQAYYCAKRFLKDEFKLSPKRAALIIVGGGDGTPSEAIRLASWMFKNMNAIGYEKHVVFSLHTDDIPTYQDTEAIKKVREMALYFNGDNHTV